MRNRIFIAVLALVCLVCPASAANKVLYKVERWEWNPKTTRLEIDFSKTDGDYVRTFYIPMMYGEGSDIFFVKGVYGRSQITIPKDWRIDCNPRHVDGIDCTSKDNGAGGAYFSPGDTIYIKRGTDLTIRYLNKEDMLDLDDESEEIVFPVLPRDKRATRVITPSQLDSVAKQLKNGSNKKDNCVVQEVKSGTQFQLPAGWFIDTDPKAVDVLRGEGEYCFGGIRFREGDVIYFKHGTSMTIRQMYEP